MEEMVQIKKDLDISTDDFYYDLFMGGYIRPEDICKYKQDAEKVRKAIETIKEFERSCEDQINDFFR